MVGIPIDERVSGPRRKIAWLPAFLLGSVGAAAAELAGGLLLYTGQGLLRSLTAVLATELLGLALGLVSSRHLEPGDLAAVRRRWLMALLAYAGAAGYSAAWVLGSGFSAAPLSQGLGLGLLGGIPLFAVGAVLGALPAAGESPGAVGAPAALGGACGVAAMGLVGVPTFEPTSVLLFCVVAVSVAALVHGWEVDGRVVVRVLAEDPGQGDGPLLRLEERIRGASGERARLVSVADRPAAGTEKGGAPLLPWERTTAELVRRLPGDGVRILVVGAAGAGLIRALESTPGRGEVEIVEPWDRIRRLRPLGGSEGWPSERRFRTEWCREEYGSAFGVVIVALRLLPGGGAMPGPGMALLESVAAVRSPRGVLLLGGVDVGEGDAASETAAWIARQAWSPPRLVLFRPGRDAGGMGASLLRPGEGAGGGLVLGGPEEAAALATQASEGGMERILDRKAGVGSGPAERAAAEDEGGTES